MRLQLLVHMRNTGLGEGVVCTEMGPGYASFVVLSARRKPGTNQPARALRAARR